MSQRITIDGDQYDVARVEQKDVSLMPNVTHMALLRKVEKPMSHHDDALRYVRDYCKPAQATYEGREKVEAMKGWECMDKPAPKESERLKDELLIKLDKVICSFSEQQSQVITDFVFAATQLAKAEILEELKK